MKYYDVRTDGHCNSILTDDLSEVMEIAKSMQTAECEAQVYEDGVCLGAYWNNKWRERK